MEPIQDMLWPTMNINLNEPLKKPLAEPGESMYAALISPAQAHADGCESVLGLLQKTESYLPPFPPRDSAPCRLEMEDHKGRRGMCHGVSASVRSPWQPCCLRS